MDTPRGFRSHPDPAEWDRLRRLRVDDLAEEGQAATTGSSRASASTASRRAASSPTSTRRQLDGPQDRRQSASSRQPRPHLRRRASSRPTSSRIPDRILYPLRRDGERGAGKWARCRWDEALDEIGGRHPQGDLRGPAARTDVSRRPSGRGRLRQPRAAGVGRRRPQQPHQRLLLVGAARTLPLERQRSPVARLRQRADDSAALVAPRDRPLFQSRTRSGSSRRSRTARR